MKIDLSKINIRLVTPEDRETLVMLFFQMLQYLDQFDHDMLPTRENAEYMVDTFLMPAAERGEPVLIAWEGEKPVGGLFWIVQDLPYQSRWKMAYGYGTFLEEGYRDQGLGKKMRERGYTILKEKGVERITGMVLLKNELSVQNCAYMGAIPIARLDHFLIK